MIQKKEKSILINFDQIWSNLTKFDFFWFFGFLWVKRRKYNSAEQLHFQKAFSWFSFPIFSKKDTLAKGISLDSWCPFPITLEVETLVFTLSGVVTMPNTKKTKPFVKNPVWPIGGWNPQKNTTNQLISVATFWQGCCHTPCGPSCLFILPLIWAVCMVLYNMLGLCAGALKTNPIHKCLDIYIYTHMYIYVYMDEWNTSCWNKWHQHRAVKVSSASPFDKGYWN